MADIKWKIGLKGTAWGEDEAMARYELTPEKFEMTGGKLFWDDEERLLVLGCLLENVGAAAAVRLGNAAVWREAVAGLRGKGA